MIVDYFNFWHFAFIILSIGSYIGLYFLLRNKSDVVKNHVLFGLLVFALILHYVKAFFPPYSNNINRFFSDIWFINICGANILIFPFIYISNSKKAKDYMFFIGVLSGLIAVCYPIEPILKGDMQIAEIWDVIRFYVHHTILWIVPLLMVTLKIHKITYKSCINAPTGLLLLMLFIMMNQLLQSELGFISLRGDNIFNIAYKNSSYIWGPGEDDAIGKFIAFFCPDIFKTLPAGSHVGEEKYWPWFWLVVPCYLVLTPLCLGISMIWDSKNFKTDLTNLYSNVKKYITSKLKKKEGEN